MLINVGVIVEDSAVPVLPMIKSAAGAVNTGAANTGAPNTGAVNTGSDVGNRIRPTLHVAIPVSFGDTNKCQQIVSSPHKIMPVVEDAFCEFLKVSEQSIL